MKTSSVLITPILASIISCGRASSSGIAKVAQIDNRQLSLIHQIEKASGYRTLYTDTTYAPSSTRGITIQNSYPKGGNIEPATPYTDELGRKYFFASFWTRLINQTDSTLALRVTFPAESFLSPLLLTPT